jgi:peptide/nickel transport system permease protein
MTVRYLIGRTGVMLITILALWMLQFSIFRLMPGDPTQSILSFSMTPEVRSELKKAWGLDKSLHKQFLIYVINFVQLDFGVSFFQDIPVIDLIKYRFWNTLVFMFVAMAWANLVGIALGVFSVAITTRRNRRGDIVLLSLGSVARSTPLFVTGILSIIVFSYWLGWFPLGGMHKAGMVYRTTFDRFLNLDFLHHLFLPTMVGGIFYFTNPFFIMRTAMLEHIGSDYIYLLKAKGQREMNILVKHVARNALNPVVTSVALCMGFAIGGQVIVETVFRWPGMGYELVSSTLRRDYPVVQGAFFLLGVIIIFMNYIADLLYLYLDPRIRYSG